MGGAQHAVRTPRHSGRARGSSAESAAVVLCGLAMGRAPTILSRPLRVTRPTSSSRESRGRHASLRGTESALCSAVRRVDSASCTAHKRRSRGGEGRGKGVSGIASVLVCTHSPYRTVRLTQTPHVVKGRPGWAQWCVALARHILRIHLYTHCSSTLNRCACQAQARD